MSGEQEQVIEGEREELEREVWGDVFSIRDYDVSLVFDQGDGG